MRAADPRAVAVELAGAPAAPRERTRWRRAHGRFFTPPSVAERVARLALAGLDAPPAIVLDPACGAGALLVAVADEIRRRWPGLPGREIASRLVGVELDPVVAAVCRDVLADAVGPGAHVVAGDAIAASLADLTGRTRFDVVVLNPPFGNAIERETSRDAATRAAHRARFPLAARGAYDRAALFVELAAAAAPRVAAVLPRAARVAPAGRALRAALEVSHGPPYAEPLAASDFPTVALALDIVAWGTSAEAPRTPEALGDTIELGALAVFRAGMTTAEAYAIRPAVEDGGEGPSLVTAGAIDPHVLHAGRRPQRYLGGVFADPRVARRALPASRLAQVDTARVLVAGLSRELEAVAVAPGECVAAVSVIQAWPAAGGPVPDVAALARLLNHPAVRDAYRVQWGAAALAGGSVPVTASRLRETRIPTAIVAAHPGEAGRG